jgi:hypothetical protein
MRLRSLGLERRARLLPRSRLRSASPGSGVRPTFVQRIGVSSGGREGHCVSTVARGGRVDSTGAAAVFFIGGILRMAVGATAVGLWLSRGRAVWIRSVSIVISFLAFFVSFVILDGIAKPTLGEVGPIYMSDEAGILVTAIVWLVIAAALLRMRPAASSGDTRFQAA